MTVNSSTRRVSYNGAGSTGPFAIPFYFLDNSHLLFTKRAADGTETVLTITTDYTVSGALDPAGGEAYTTANLAIGERLVITGNVPLTQGLSLPETGLFSTKAAEQTLDKIVMITQQLQEQVNRSILLNVTSSATKPIFDDPIGDRVLLYSSDGLSIIPGPSAEEIENAENFSELAESWAIGAIGDRPEGSAKYWAEEAGAAALPDGSVARAKLTGALSSAISVSVLEFGATGDGITDDTSAIQDAIDSGAKRIIFPATLANTYKVTSDITCNRSVCIEFESNTTILDGSSGSFTRAVLDIYGAITQIQDLNANVAQGATSLTFTSAPSLSALDVACIWNPTDNSWFPVSGRKYNDGEFFKVHSVSGSTVKLFGRIKDAYTAADCDVYKLAPMIVVLENVNVKAPASGSIAPWYVQYGTQVYLSNVSGYNSGYCAGVLDRCYNVQVDAATAYNNSTPGGDEYGLTIASCQQVTAQGIFYASRHAVAIGAYEGTPLCVANRNVLIHDSILSNDSTTNIGAGDMHGCVDNVTYDNCIFENGAVMAGRNPTYRNCKIYNNSNGVCIYAAEIYGGTYILENCDFITNVDPQANGPSMGIIHLAPQSSQVEDMTLILRNCRVNGRNLTSSTHLVQVRPNNSTKKCNVVVDGLSVDVNALGSYLFAGVTAGTYFAERLIVDNVDSNVSGAFLIYPHASIASIPTREMAQRGAVSVSLTNGTAISAAPNQSYKYAYSRLPTATLGISATDGSVKSSYGGTRPTLCTYALGATSLRPAVQPPSGTFSSDDTALLHWQVGVFGA